MTRDLNATQFEATVGLATYTLGFALLPLVTTSFSEEFGRQPIYLVTGAGCLLMHMMTALYVSHPHDLRSHADYLWCSQARKTSRQ